MAQFNNIKDTKRWLMHMENVFNPIARVYLGKKYCPIEIVVGNLSYTDHKKIQVGVTEEEALTLSKAELTRVLTLKVYHECGHCKYTDRAEYEACVFSIADYWEAEAKKDGLNPYKNSLINLAAELSNSLEDGRMENQVVKDVPGVQKHRVWYRLREWLKVSSATNQAGPFYEVLNNILTIATMGMYNKDFETTYPIGTKIRDTVDACIAPISEFITSATVAAGAPHALAVAKEIKDFIIEQIKKEPAGNGPQIINLPKEIEDMIRKALEEGVNFSDNDTEEIDNDGPVIGFLTDDDEETEEGNRKEGKKPDILIDLRKNPPKKTAPKAEEEQNNSEDASENGKGESSESSGESAEEEKSEGSEGPEDDPEEGEGKASGNSEETNSDDTASEVDLDSLQAGAKDFEASIKDRLAKAEIEGSAEISARIRKADKEMEFADKAEEGNTKLTAEDVDFLHKAGYLEGYLDKVPSRNIFKDENCSLNPTTIDPYIVKRGRQIENQLKNIIAAQSDYDRDGLYDGELDGDAIGRFVAFGQGDIFCQEGEPKEPDMCVYVRQDNSGSMSGSKFRLACEAGALIEQAFKNLVPLKLTYFTDTRFDIIKDWNDNENRSYMTDFGHYFNSFGCNDDALAIMSAALELTHRPESKKVLIVISDGGPCCSTEAVTAAVQWARKHGIFVISFFIGDKNFIESSWETYKQMYEKYFCGVSPEKLGSILIRFLRNLIES